MLDDVTMKEDNRLALCGERTLDESERVFVLLFICLFSICVKCAVTGNK